MDLSGTSPTKNLLFFGSWNYLDGVGSVDHHLGEELSVSTDELARHRSLDRVDETLLAQLVDRVTQMFLHRDRKGQVIQIERNERGNKNGTTSPNPKQLEKGKQIWKLRKTNEI